MISHNSLASLPVINSGFNKNFNDFVNIECICDHFYKLTNQNETNNSRINQYWQNSTINIAKKEVIQKNIQ